MTRSGHQTDDNAAGPFYEVFRAHTDSLVDVTVDDRSSGNLATSRDDLIISAGTILIAESACTILPRGFIGSWGITLSINPIGERKDKREELAKLKHAALVELERRGYAVHGKTPGQIREMLKRRPKKSACASINTSPCD